MTFRRIAVGLCLAILPIACLRTPIVAKKGQTDFVEGEGTFTSDDAIWREVVQKDADGTLAVEISIPGFVDKIERRIHLKKNPKGMHYLHSHQFAADGRGFGAGGHIGIGGGSLERVKVETSLYWKSPDAQTGVIAESFEVPWFGVLQLETQNGAKIRAYFDPPKKKRRSEIP